MPHLTPKDLKLIIDILREAIDEIVRKEVAASVREIPYRVDEHLRHAIGRVVREEINSHVNQSLEVSVRLR